MKGRAFIYCRISADKEGGGEGVERQLQDCRDWCEAHGYVVAQEFIDNDVSAFSGVKRPQFEAMLQHLREDVVDTVVVWKSDRLARRGKDLQRFLDTGVTLSSCTEPEFTGSTGLLMLRILSGFAEHESGVKSERVARKMLAKAKQGDPHAGGKRCFGYTADGRMTVRAEADKIREAASRVLAGETITDIGKSWGGIPCGSTGNFKRLLRSPRLIGMREVGGQLVEGNFPAVLDRATWDRLQACVTVKHRPGQPRARRYLLTGLLHCGRCGTPLNGSPQGYRCPTPLLGGCGRISVGTERTDEYVSGVVLAALETIEEPENPEAQVQVLLAHLKSTEASIAQLAKDHYVEKIISRPAYLAANDELEERAQLLRVEVAEHETGGDPAAFGDVAEKWEHQTLSWKQAVVRLVLERVVVQPAKSTRAPVSERLDLVPRRA